MSDEQIPEFRNVRYAGEQPAAPLTPYGQLAAAEAQVVRLTAALRDALDDLEARDELSALDGLRAALAPGEPSAEPGTEE